jgi:soluble cytochrome b562
MQEVASIPVEELAKYPDEEIEKLSALVNKTPAKPVAKTAQDQTLPPKEDIPAGISQPTPAAPATETIEGGDGSKPPMEPPKKPEQVSTTVPAWVGDVTALPKEVQEKIGAYLKDYQEGIKISAAQLDTLIIRKAQESIVDQRKEAEFNEAFDKLAEKIGADAATQLALNAYLGGLNEARQAQQAAPRS